MKKLATGMIALLVTVGLSASASAFDMGRRGPARPGHDNRGGIHQPYRGYANVLPRPAGLQIQQRAVSLRGVISLPLLPPLPGLDHILPRITVRFR